MRIVPVVSVIVLSVAGALLFWRQRATNARMESVLAAVREQASDVSRLRTDNDRLARAEVENRGELSRLRAELAALRATGKTPASAPGSATVSKPDKSALLPPGAPLQPGLKPIAAFTNAGKATARAALETRTWADQGGDTRTVADTMVLLPDARQKAEELFARLSETARAQYRTPEELLATAFAGASGNQTLGMQVLSEQIGARVDGMDPTLRQDPGYRTLRVQSQYANGSVREMDVVFQQTSDGWRQVIQANTVLKAGSLLGLGLKPPVTKPEGGR